jgi:SNF2 family DNA or RNA helicase
MTTTATTAPVGRKSLEPYILDSVLYYPHQVDGIRELCKRKSFLLADDMGLGKSLQALTVFGVDVVRGWASTMLIVCPVTLKGNWADEIQRFTRFQFAVLDGSPTQRAKQLIQFAELNGPKILIINYEQVAPHKAELNAMNFDIACFDEAHYLKNHKAKRTQACLSVNSRRSFLLTGTPMLNHVNELWALLHRISPNEYPKYWSFLNRYAVFGGYKDKQIVGVKNEKELTERLQRVMLRRLKKDVLNLPEIQIIERRVDLAPEQREVYQQIVEDMRVARPEDMDDEDIENALTKFLRLKEVCGTTKKFTGVDISSKLDLAVADAIELLQNDYRPVVFTQFREVQECFATRLDKEAPEFDIWTLHGDVKMSDRVPIVREWSNDPKPGAIVCMLQVAGVGLNMTASRHAMFLDKLFVPGLNQQAIDRLHRIGQDETQPVQVFEYICRNTIENRVNQINRIKSKLFGEIVESDPGWKRKLLKAIMEDDD